MPEPAFDPDPSPGPPLPLAADASVGKGDAPPKSLDSLTGGNDAQYDAITKADLSLTKQKIGSEAGMEAQRKRSDEAYAQRQERLIAAEGATMDDIKPWNAEKELNSRKTDLWEQFGSPGFIIAMLASTFTAMPMNSALNAGAAAMNAINQGDMDKYNKSFDAWKENSNLTLKRLELEEHEFGQIEELRTKNMESWRASASALAARFNDKRLQILLENGMDQQALEAMDAKAKSKVELSDATRRIQENETRRQVTMALLGDSKDPKKLAQAAADAETIMTAPKTPEQMAVANVISQPGFRDQPVEDQNKQIQNALRGVASARYGGHTTPIMGELQRQLDASDAEHPDDTEQEKDARHIEIIKNISSAQKPAGGGAPSMAKEQAQLVEDLLKKDNPETGKPYTREEAIKRAKAAAAPPPTGNKLLDLKSHIGQYDDAIRIIDGIDKTLDRYVGAAGVAGRATRLGERVGNVLGSNNTDRTQMMRDIEQLQLMGPRLLLDQKTGRPLSQEAGHISDIIAGLNMGDTTANTKRAMKEIKERLETIRDRNKAELPGAGEAPAAAPAPVEDKPWENDPVTH
jgi:hypothetical protein